MTRQELRLYQANDETLLAYVTEVDGQAPHDLTGDPLVQLIIKDTPGADDVGAVVLSTGSGEVTVTDAEAGEVEIAIGREYLAEAGTRWWRLDVVRPGSRRTAVYGELYVVDV